MRPGSRTCREILDQGESWSATLGSLEEQSTGLRQLLHRPHREATFIGCGSTYFLSLAASTIWQAMTGVSARALPSSELWLFPELYRPAQPSLLVAVSRSGETTETLRALEMYRQQIGGDSLAITCDPASEMVGLASSRLVARNAAEESVAQTRSFTSMLLLAQLACALAADREDYLSQLNALPAFFPSLVKTYEPLARRLARDERLEHFVFLGSGPRYGLACEAMLKMKEMSLSPSEAFHFLEFRHGPKSTASKRTLVIGLLSESARDHEASVLSEMRQLGTKVLALAESAEGLPADEAIELRSGLDEQANLALFLPALQLLAYHRAVHKGLDPDRPANLDAVVRLPA